MRELRTPGARDAARRRGRPAQHDLEPVGDTARVLARSHCCQPGTSRHSGRHCVATLSSTLQDTPAPTLSRTLQPRAPNRACHTCVAWSCCSHSTGPAADCARPSPRGGRQTTSRRSQLTYPQFVGQDVAERSRCAATSGRPESSRSRRTTRSAGQWATDAESSAEYCLPEHCEPLDAGAPELPPPVTGCD